MTHDQTHGTARDAAPEPAHEPAPDAAAAVSTGPSQARRSDVLAMLTADHRRVDALLADGRRLADSSSADRSGLASQIGALLSAHMQAEEDVLYPALPAGTDRARQEHDLIRESLLALSAPDLPPQAFAAQWALLAEAVQTHVAEEESQLFPQARALDLDDLGARLAARRGELLGPQGSD